MSGNTHPPNCAALAAIQGLNLNQKLERELRVKEFRLEALERELADLKESLSRIQ